MTALFLAIAELCFLMYWKINAISFHDFIEWKFISSRVAVSQAMISPINQMLDGKFMAPPTISLE